MPAAQLPSDADLAVFSQSVELAVAAAYDALSPRFAARAQSVVAGFRFHHVVHAVELGRAAGTSASVAANPAVSAVLAPLVEAATDEPSALQLVFTLENQLAATHAFSLTTAENPSTVRAVATILPVESTHAVVTGELLGKPIGDLFVNGSFESTLVGAGTDARVGFSPFVFGTR